MANYLLKTEPDTYSFQDLLRDHETVWDGVTNPVAVNHLRRMQEGDRLVIYHTGETRTVVGTATVVSIEADGKTALVRIRAGHILTNPKTLATIKQHAIFSDSPLVHQGRLSVVPLSAEQYNWLVG